MEKKRVKASKIWAQGNKFVNRTAMACAVRSRIDKWDLIKKFVGQKILSIRQKGHQQIGKEFLSILNLIGD